jgi:hypothetical protein
MKNMSSKEVLKILKSRNTKTQSIISPKRDLYINYVLKDALWTVDVSRDHPKYLLPEYNFGRTLQINFNKEYIPKFLTGEIVFPEHSKLICDGCTNFRTNIDGEKVSEYYTLYITAKEKLLENDLKYLVKYLQQFDSLIETIGDIHRAKLEFRCFNSVKWLSTVTHIRCYHNFQITLPETLVTRKPILEEVFERRSTGNSTENSESLLSKIFSTSKKVYEGMVDGSIFRY